MKFLVETGEKKNFLVRKDFIFIVDRRSCSMPLDDTDDQWASLNDLFVNIGREKEAFVLLEIQSRSLPRSFSGF